METSGSADERVMEYTYDKVGNLKSYNDGVISVQYGYDDLYQKISDTVDYDIFSLSNTYTYKTSAGLKIRAALHTQQYQRGIRICDKEMKEINLKHYTQRPKWNYSISPSKNAN